MKYSLYIKFLFGYILFGIMSFILIVTASSKMIANHLIKEKSNLLYNEAHTLAYNYSSIYNSNDNSDLSAAYPQLNALAKYLNARIIVLNRTGEIIIDTDSSVLTNSKLNGFDPSDLKSRYTIGNFYNHFDEECISVISAITGNLSIKGYITIHLPMSNILESRGELLNILYITFAFIFVFSLLILLVFTKVVYLPLKKITYAANRYAAGDLKYQQKIESDDEIGYLSATLNYMASELDEMEKYQKNFIANVSHDFRSPLTSIKGYVEAILDGTIPHNMQEKYLQIVITETERLNKLTERMLELNHSDGKGAYLTKTNFDIHRIINQTVELFEGVCSNRNIILDLTYSQEVQMVHADMEKIQQIIYNLIDNAIKFSKNNSTIYIETTSSHNKLFTMIRDSGIGISRSDQNKIWERFYKSDTSRGKDKKGTGLGLAIVKDIINAHKENIDVISTEGVGTEFIFSLPCSNREK
jgi:Signal transduction histidine kinase